MSTESKSSHGQIIKSSALIGSSSLLNIVFGVVRTKVMALLLGPSGVGLFGNFAAISDLVRTVGGLGINISGVRQIAEAVGTGDEQKIARTVTALRRVALYSGAAGALLLLVLCRPLSWMTFGDYEHTGSVALLALAVFCLEIASAQGALVQGMRRIADLARISVWGALFGTLFSIPIVYFWREQGVVPSLVCVAGMGILTSWWYARKVKVERVALDWREVYGEASELVKLGVVFMASGLMTMGANYLVRAIITREMSIDDAGYYQSAWVLGGLYVGYILSAMGADFYPRLTASAKNNAESNRLVNEQTEVGLLIAGPGVLATLAFAPLVIQVFYSAKFGPAVGLLRWICVGMLLRVASWPMGYLLAARGERKLYFWSELVSNAVYIGLVWVGVVKYRLTGAGVAFFGLYVFYLFGMHLVSRRLSGFGWSAANLKLAALLTPLVAGVFLVSEYAAPVPAAVVGGLATLLAGVYSLRALCGLVPLEKLPRLAQKMLTLFRLTPLGHNARAINP